MAAMSASVEADISSKNSTKNLKMTDHTPSQTSSDKEIKQNFSIEIENKMKMLIEEEIMKALCKKDFLSGKESFNSLEI